MYLRLVHVNIKPEILPKLRQFYEVNIIPRLQKMAGCLYAGLIQSEHHQNECISMTLWDTQIHAEDYEASGLFKKLLQEAQPYLSDSSEWKIQLSKELRLEYQPVPEEPLVKSYASVAQTDIKVPAFDKIPLMYLRVLSVKIKPGKMEEFREIYTEEVIRALRTTKACRYAYLAVSFEEKNEVISVTIWDNKQDAENCEKSGLFDILKEKAKHTFAELYQWKMALEKEYSAQIVTSEDLTVKHYSIVTGKILQ